MESNIFFESRFESGQGSAIGRNKGITKGKEGQGKVEAEKSKARIYNTIDDALHQGYFGQIFSTKGSDRLYVITKSKWGKSGQQTVGSKTAKGFYPGTIPSSLKDVKKYAKRTLLRHGGGKRQGRRRYNDAN